MTQLLKLLINHRSELTTWNDVSSPNGSAYKNESLVPGSHHTDDGVIEIVKHGPTWVCASNGQSVSVAIRRCSSGPGLDLGAHYCTRNQELAIFSDNPKEQRLGYRKDNESWTPTTK